MADSATRIPTPSDIGLARRRLASHIRETPILESRAVSADAGVRIRFKCEMFQRGGSHKIRGAMNWALETSETESIDGVVTATSGNHGAAMAIATATIGVPLAAVMPDTSSRIKREAAASYGAEVHHRRSRWAQPRGHRRRHRPAAGLAPEHRGHASRDRRARHARARACGRRGSRRGRCRGRPAWAWRAPRGRRDRAPCS